MGFIEKLKLLFKARKPITDIIHQVDTVKSGWKTLPFWITFVGTLISLAAALEGAIPKVTALIIMAVLTFFYNVLRGATKASLTEQKPVFQTSEFWIGVIGSLSACLTSIQSGGVNPIWLTTALGMIGVGMTAAQNLAGQSPTPGAIPPPPATPAAK